MHNQRVYSVGMNAKKHISKMLESKGIDVSVDNLTRYVNGTRNPSISVAKAIAELVDCTPYIWLDPALTTQRKNVLRVYAKKNNLPVYFFPGRPKENNQPKEV